MARDADVEPEPEPRPAAKPYDVLDLARFLAEPPADPDWDWRGYYARGDVVLEAGDPGIGKSMNVLARQAKAATGGGDHLGEHVAARRCVYVDLESPTDVVYQRLWAHGVSGPVDGFAYVHRPAGFNLLDSGSFARLRRTLIVHQAEQVWIDSLRRAAPGLDENDSRAVSIVLTGLRELAAELHLTIGVVHHPRKPIGDSRVDALYAARGSGDLVGSVDSFIFHRRLAGGLVKIEHPKSRRGREHDPVHYRILEDDDGAPRIEHVHLEHGLDDEAQAALLDTVVAYVTNHPGASQRDVRDQVKGQASAITRALQHADDQNLLVLGPGRARNGKYYYPSEHALFSSSDDQGRPGTTSAPGRLRTSGRPARPAPVGGTTTRTTSTSGRLSRRTRARSGRPQPRFWNTLRARRGWSRDRS